MLLSNLFESNFSLLTEAKARIEHPEDLIFDQGLAGAKNAVQILKTSAANPRHVSIKFDGCVHPDSVVVTDTGEMRIIDLINSPYQHNVLSHNFETGQDQFCLAEFPRINNNQKKWVQIDLEDGSNLKLTEDHEVYTTNRGWVKAGELLPEDDIKEIQR